MPIYPYDMGRSHRSWFLSCIAVLKRLMLFCNLLRDLQLNPLPAAKSDDATTSFFLCFFWFGKNILLRVIPTMTFTDLLLANLLAFYLTYLLAFDLGISSKSSGMLSGISSGVLSGISSGVLSGISSGILSGISHGILSGISSGILSDIISGISSGILSGR